MMLLLKFVIPMLVLDISTQAQNGDTNNKLSTAVHEDLVNELSQSFVDADYTPQKPAQNISKEILLNNPRLSFLGSYNGKSWYIERTRVSQDTARVACTSLGMQLARFSNQNEVDFVAQSTTSADDYSWTDGRNYRNPAGFVWHSDVTSLFQGVILSYSNTVGLTLSRYSSNSRLAAYPSTSLQYYICFL